MVSLSATVVQGGCGKCNNCFDVYKLLMSNDIDRPHPGASTVVMKNNELYWSGLTPFSLLYFFDPDITYVKLCTMQVRLLQ